jgi:hypothetical protein
VQIAVASAAAPADALLGIGTGAGNRSVTDATGHLVTRTIGRGGGRNATKLDGRDTDKQCSDTWRESFIKVVLQKVLFWLFCANSKNTLSMVTIEMVSCDTRAVESLELPSEVDACRVTRGADEATRASFGLYGPHDLVGSGSTAERAKA